MLWTNVIHRSLGPLSARGPQAIACVADHAVTALHPPNDIGVPSPCKSIWTEKHVGLASDHINNCYTRHTPLMACGYVREWDG